MAPPALALAIVAAYGSAFAAPFFFDDIPAIHDNPHIRTLALPEALGSAPRLAPHGRPVVALSLALNYAAGRLDPVGYRLLNVGVHLAAALALFGILRRTLLLAPFRDRWGTQSAPLGFAAALLWALHPLQTEAVTYVTCRTESMMGMFYLLTLYAFLRGAADSDLETRDPKRETRWLGASVCFALLGAGCKEVIVSAPLLVLLFDRILVAGTFRAALRERGRYYAALAAATWLTLALLVWSTHAERANATGFHFAHMTPWDYLRMQCGIVVRYLRLSLLPAPLVADYYDWPRPASVLGWLVPGAALSALALGALLAWRRRPWWTFLAAWLFAVLAPSSSVLPITTEVAAERRMYLPLAALAVPAAVASAGALRAALAPGAARFAGGLLLTAVAGLLFAQTWIRNSRYAEPTRIWSDAVAERPRNTRAHNNLGDVQFDAAIELAESPEKAHPRFRRRGKEGVARMRALALRHFRKALVLEPGHAHAVVNLGVCLAKEGLPTGDTAKLEQAIRYFRAALQMDPDSMAAHYSLGLVCLGSRRFEEAIEAFSAVIRIDPTRAQGHSNLGAALSQAGRQAEAIGHLRRAAELEPDDAAIRENLGVALAKAGRYQEAMASYAQSLRLDPGQASVYGQLGAALLKTGRSAEAALRFRESLRLRPGWFEPMHRLAWILATDPDPSLRDGDEALRLAEGAVAQAGRKHAAAMDALAAALAEAGRYDEARATALEAAAAAREQKETALADAIALRAEVYAAGKPFREGR